MSEPVLKCPSCSQEWQITGDGKARCGSCGYEIKLPVYICPKCAEQALVKQDDLNNDKTEESFTGDQHGRDKPPAPPVS